MNKLPWTKWYFTDWRNDSALSVCSLAARGLWADMLAVMYDSEDAGHLELAGKPMTAEQIARTCRCNPQEVETLLPELEAAGVFSKDKRGVIYSRRLVREAAERKHTRARVHKFREAHTPKKSATCNAPCNGNVTPEKQKQKQITTGRHTHNKGRVAPPDLDTVKAEAARIGHTPKQAERFFAYWQARDWKHADGKPVVKWREFLATWTARGSERSGGHSGNGTGKPRQREAWKVKEEIAIVKSERAKIVSRMEDAARRRYGGLTSDEAPAKARECGKPEDVTAYDNAKARLKELEAELARCATTAAAR